MIIAPNVHVKGVNQEKVFFLSDKNPLISCAIRGRARGHTRGRVGATPFGQSVRASAPLRRHGGRGALALRALPFLPTLQGAGDDPSPLRQFADSIGKPPAGCGCPLAVGPCALRRRRQGRRGGQDVGKHKRHREGEGRGAREGHRGREEASKDRPAEWTQKRAYGCRHTPACVPFGGELLRARFKALLSWLVPLYSPFLGPFGIAKS